MFSLRHNTIDFLKIKFGVEVEGGRGAGGGGDGGGRCGWGGAVVERSIEDEQQNEWSEHELQSP